MTRFRRVVTYLNATGVNLGASRLSLSHANPL